MGVYCINAARYLFRAEPQKVFSWNFSSPDKRFEEVPEMTCGLLKFPNDRVASFATVFGAADRPVFEVIGTKGVLTIDPAFEMAEDLKCEITIGGRNTKECLRSETSLLPN
jgi:predicted dehydrogenase